MVVCVCGVGGLLLTTHMLSSSSQRSLSCVAASPKLPVPFGLLSGPLFLVRRLLGLARGALILLLSEKQKLKNSDYPLIARILQGPCEQVSKVFLMEKDQVEEVTYDVSPFCVVVSPQQQGLGWQGRRLTGLQCGFLTRALSLWLSCFHIRFF